MLFNSFQYLIFLPAVTVVFFSLPHRFRWMLLLGASYYFYMCWKAEYVLLIAGVTLVNYAGGLAMGRSPDPRVRKAVLLLCLSISLGLLIVFKYLDFIGGTLQAFLDGINVFSRVPVFNLLLPVGISFFTFQALSYAIDVYKGTTPVEKHPGIFALYVAFFPQLVAGPIERSDRLLPQFYERKRFSYPECVAGLKLITWGFFKKLVIADRLAAYVNAVYGAPESYDALRLVLATLMFTVQIYCDFSGYSDIAIGSARIMGYRLMLNFNQPYFSGSLTEFWQRWHISLSSWFRDYLYTPAAMAMRSMGANAVYPAILLTFTVSGLWHGAAWTFVFWGILHGAGLAFCMLLRMARKKWKGVLPRSFPAWLTVPVTFGYVCFTFVFFRAGSWSDALTVLRRIAAGAASAPGAAGAGLFAIPRMTGAYLGVTLFFTVVLAAVDFTAFRNRLPVLQTALPRPVRWAGYYLLILCIFLFGNFGHVEFIYFQF